MVDQITKVKKSKRYKVLFETLDKFFNQTYKVKGIICDEDSTSSDFHVIIDLPNLKGIDMSVGGSGPRQMYRLGENGTIAIGVPKEDGLLNYLVV